MATKSYPFAGSVWVGELGLEVVVLRVHDVDRTVVAVNRKGVDARPYSISWPFFREAYEPTGEMVAVGVEGLYRNCLAYMDFSAQMMCILDKVTDLSLREEIRQGALLAFGVPDQAPLAIRYGDELDFLKYLRSRVVDRPHRPGRSFRLPPEATDFGGAA
jgi:hypothetical protein